MNEKLKIYKHYIIPTENNLHNDCFYSWGANDEGGYYSIMPMLRLKGIYSLDDIELIEVN